MKYLFSFHTKTLCVWCAACVLFAAACNRELLEPTPETLISEFDVFDTPARVANMVNGLYSSMKGGLTFTGSPGQPAQFMSGRYFALNDARGEEFINETGNTVTGVSTWNHTLVATTNEVNFLWSDAYRAINNCNLFIDGLQANRDVLKDKVLVSNYLSEARFLRALTYFCLVNTYARPFADGNGDKPGLPLRLTGQRAGGENDLARSTVAQVYAQILEDLNAAEENLPVSYATPALNTTRAHRNTAIALKTRVYLALGRWADVIKEADKIVSAAAPFQAGSGVSHALQPSITAVFTTPYTTPESIFSMPFSENNLPGTQNGLGLYYLPAPKGGGEYSLNANGIMGDTTWREKDARRVNFVTATGGKMYLSKFPVGPQHTDWAPVIRYAEVLLNLSEAIARTEGVSPRAIALLNAVRRRSDPSVTFTAAQFANGAALVDAILKERRIELIGEGFRAFDCTRLLLPLPGKANVAAILPTQSSYIWPIPQVEMAVNRAVVQNP
jgi:starch-binding outer membrane protein, SusD/RagB family